MPIPEEFQDVTLDESWIPQMVRLQECGGNGQIVPKTATDLCSHFKAGCAAIGIVSQKGLVAQGLITPQTLQQGALNPAFAYAASGQRTINISKIGCLVVAPEAQGNGLAGRILERWLDALPPECDLAHALVRTGNDASLCTFGKQGFRDAGVGRSPDKPHGPVHWLYKRVGSNALRAD